MMFSDLSKSPACRVSCVVCIKFSNALIDIDGTGRGPNPVHIILYCITRIPVPNGCTCLHV